MQVWREMRDKSNVWQRRERIGILRAGELKRLIGHTARRFEEERFERVLAVCSEGSEIRKDPTILIEWRDRKMRLRVDGAIERSNSARAEARLQFGKGTAAGVAQDKVEIARGPSSANRQQVLRFAER